MVAAGAAGTTHKEAHSSINSVIASAMMAYGETTFAPLVSRTRCSVRTLLRRAGTQQAAYSLMHGPRLCSAPLKERCA
ncbi:hypothetical protein ABID58_005647, partial [Bradyrhizobium sp. S3.2.6]